MMRSLKTIFFGSGPVAAKSLELLARDFDIEAVVTKPKPEHHHGKFPVLDVAKTLDLAVHTVSNKAELSALMSTSPFTSQFGILIDFGIIVAKDTIDYFPKGIINSHFSLLPEWRGADPITFSLLSGQAKTGVSLMLLDIRMDTGKLIAQRSIKIPVGATTPTLTDELIELSYRMLVEFVPAYIDGSISPRNQPHPDRATYSRKLTKDDGILDFSKSAEQLEREVRAFIEWPKSRTTIAGMDCIITKASVAPKQGTPGTVTVSDKQLLVYCSSNALNIEQLKPAGKSLMSAEAFLAGYGKNL
jgi:methionyl-tRNA formyltransferase